MWADSEAVEATAGSGSDEAAELLSESFSDSDGWFSELSASDSETVADIALGEELDEELAASSSLEDIAAGPGPTRDPATKLSL